MEDGDIQIRDLWEAVLRLVDQAGSEGDGGCEAIQNYNPGATRPAAVRNAADLKGLASRGDRPRGRMLRGGCERGGRGRRVERVMALWQCRSRFSFAFAMQI